MVSAGLLLLACLFCRDFLAQAQQGPTTGFPLLTAGRPTTPLTAGGKFKYALDTSLLSPVSYAYSAAGAGISLALDSPQDNEYGGGAAGFGRRFADRVGTTAVGQLSGAWIAASILHQDPRFFPSVDPRFRSRLANAVRSTFVAHGDGGDRQFNSSNMIGILAAAGASISWHRRQDRTVGNYLATCGSLVTFDILSNLSRELFRRNRR